MSVCIILRKIGCTSVNGPSYRHFQFLLRPLPAATIAKFQKTVSVHYDIFQNLRRTIIARALNYSTVTFILLF